MAINYDELGKRISYFRARKGFSQETLGERIGVNNKHISNIEIGKSRPSLDSLVRLSHNLCKPPERCRIEATDRRYYI